MREGIVGYGISLNLKEDEDGSSQISNVLDRGEPMSSARAQECKDVIAYFLNSPSKTLSLLSSPALPISGSVAGAPSSSVYA
jgi:hypothetical protein